MRGFALITALFILNICFSQTDSLEYLLSSKSDELSNFEKLKLHNRLIREYRYKNPQKALFHGYQARKYHQDIEACVEKGNTFNLMGNVYFDRGVYDLALKSYHKCLEISEEIKDNKAIAYSYNDIGYVYFNQNFLNLAIEQYSKAFEYFEKDSNKVGISHTYNNSGMVYAYKGEYDKAEKYYLKSLDILIKIQDSSKIAQVYTYLGNVNKSRQEYDKSLDYYKKAEHIYKSIDNKRFMAHTYQYMGNINMLLNDFEKSIAYYLRAYNLFEKTEHFLYGAETLVQLSRLYKQYKMPQKAMQTANMALNIANENSYITLKTSCLKLISEIYETIGDYENAYITLGKHAHSREIMFNEDVAKSISNVQSKLETEKQERENMILRQVNKEKENSFFMFTIVFSLLLLSLIIILVLLIQKNKTSKKYNHDIELQKEKFRKLFENSVIGIYRASPQGTILLANNFLGKILGYSVNELVGKNIKDLFAEKDDELKQFLKMTEQKQIIDSKSPWIKKNGKKLCVKQNIRVEKDKSGRILFYDGIVEDVSDSSIAEEKIESIKKKLLTNERAKNKLFSIINFEMKGPVKTLLSISGLMNKTAHSFSNDTGAKTMRELETQARIINELIENLSLWNSIDKGNLKLQNKTQNLSTIIDEILIEHKILYQEKNISVNQKYPNNLIISCDSKLIKIVLRNIISNAIKYTPENGKIDITGAITNNNLELNIQDTGDGINPIIINNINQAFYSTQYGTNNEKGSGLGLFLIHKVIEAHHGNINFESYTGQNKGTKVTISLLQNI